MCLSHLFLRKKGERSSHDNEVAVLKLRYRGWLTEMESGSSFRQFVMINLAHKFIWWGSDTKHESEHSYLLAEAFFGDGTESTSATKAAFYWYSPMGFYEEHKICKIGNMRSRSSLFHWLFSLNLFQHAGRSVRSLATLLLKENIIMNFLIKFFSIAITQVVKFVYFKFKISPRRPQRSFSSSATIYLGCSSSNIFLA